MNKFHNMPKEECRQLIDELEEYEALLISRETTLETSDKYAIVKEGLAQLDKYLETNGIISTTSISKLYLDKDKQAKFLDSKSTVLNISMDISNAVKAEELKDVGSN